MIMEENNNKDAIQKQESQNKQEHKKKKETMAIEDIAIINQKNLEQISALEDESENYDKEQNQRDKNWQQTEIEIQEKITLLKNELQSLNENLLGLRADFSILTNNFKNWVKDAELKFIKDKIDFIKFEELATQQDLEKIKTSQQ